MEKFKVKFYPDKKTVEVAKDTTILSAALTGGIYINSACGGDGVCGKCKVTVKKGKVAALPNNVLTLKEKKRHIYLACQTVVQGSLEVAIPSESRLDFEKLSQEQLNLPRAGLYEKSEEIEALIPSLAKDVFEHSPLTKKLYLELPAPDLNDRISDLERLYRQIGRLYQEKSSHLQIALANIKQLGELLRDSDWKVTVTLGKRDGITEIINIEPGDTSRKNFGVCFDIGTTTISGQLIDLNSNKILSTKATYNKQASFGSDVITRIIYAQEEDGLKKLHNAVVNTANEMLKVSVQEHKVDPNDVTCVLCTGNTTMIHLLLGVDPKYIRREPYVPTANFVPVIRASEAGININPRGILACVPGVASYVGGDTTSGVLSCRLYKEDNLGILIDIGTNGEITVGNKEFLVACAASAGPAFEGSGLRAGMRAGSGAIQKVEISGRDLEVTYETIGRAKPRGICGSGYIDIIAGLLRSGILDKAGRIKVQKHKRIRKSEAGYEFVVAFKRETSSGSDIVVSEADIENLKRAKAAIYSATAVLIRHMNLELPKVKKIFIAGGFGTYLDMENAIAIGLLPDIERAKFIFVGNSALQGARQMLLSSAARHLADEIARKITYFELSVDPGYMDEYVAALFFPHTDLSKFPSVRG